ncbi:MAG: tRNA pseudouridine(55) synthase TruB [Spirochaetaceae bacterium]|nr:tRNA pseudouridine(55) synthase TruB [Spirochaetaceae bacterium]
MKKSSRSKYSGYILLNKKPGIASFDSLGRIKRALETGKVGHAGTLDSFAQGLLIVLVGRATRLASWFSDSVKSYRGTILFGEETATLDGEGEVIARAEPPSRQALEKALPDFSGDILQAPPAYSALHIKGERAYALARRGVEPVMEKRPVTVYELTLDAYESPLGEITVRCSKGTYIRSLARDLALAAGSRGRLVSLTRTAIGGFSLDDALCFDGDDDEIRAALKPIDKASLARLGLPVFELDEKAALAMLHGRPLDPLSLIPCGAADAEDTGLVPGPLGVFSAGRGFLGILEYQDGVLRSRCVYAQDETASRPVEMSGPQSRFQTVSPEERRANI